MVFIFWVTNCLQERVRFQVGLFPDILERKVMRHFEEGDHVRQLIWDTVSKQYFSENMMLILYMWFMKGFSYGNRRILYQEGAFSRICPAICFQCRGFAEVSKNFL